MCMQVRTSRTFLRDCTVVSPMALLLFGGELVVVHEGGYALIDNWIRIRASAPTAVLVKQLRAALDALLEKKVGSLPPQLTQFSATQMWITYTCDSGLCIISNDKGQKGVRAPESGRAASAQQGLRLEINKSHHACA